MTKSAVSALFSLSSNALRHQTWRTLKAISERLDLIKMFPQDC